jgi:hypothetical protein
MYPALNGEYLSVKATCLHEFGSFFPFLKILEAVVVMWNFYDGTLTKNISNGRNNYSYK